VGILAFSYPVSLGTFNSSQTSVVVWRSKF
jgi:hypothetical protein